MMTSRGAIRAVNAALLLAHAGLLLSGAFQNFAVVDEAAHIPAGISHWRTGRFEAYRVNPPLARMLAVLPALVVNPSDGAHAPEVMDMDRPEWLMAIAFQKANWNKYLAIVRLARLPGIAISVFGAWLVGRWARELHGEFAGSVAIALWAFEPTIVAFGQAVTSDVPAAVAVVAACHIFRRFLMRPSWQNAVSAGLVLGVAQLLKFTLLVLYPIYILALPFAMARQTSKQSQCVLMRQFAAMFAISIGMINLGYGLRGSFQPLGTIPLSSRLLDGRLNASGSDTNRFSGSWLGALPIPVPADYVMGIDLQKRDFESGLPSYLRGEWRHHGWWYYYLYAMAVKVPLGTSALIVVGMALALRRVLTHPTLDEWLLLAPAISVIALVSAQTGFNHHMRYVLPSFPFLILLASGVSSAQSPSRHLVRLVTVLLVCWSAVGCLRVHPHEMSHFNEAAGGPTRGHEHLVDSNIDWGQDLLFLAKWVQEHPEARPLHLAYYHFLDPRMIALDFSLPPRGPSGLFLEDERYQSRFGPKPGYHAVSVNHLRGSRFVAPDGRGGLYHATRGDFEYFRSIKPIARAGYSIYIYHIP
jgi:hypothetical protein